jgi:hypothetical protein
MPRDRRDFGDSESLFEKSRCRLVAQIVERQADDSSTFAGPGVTGGEELLINGVEGPEGRALRRGRDRPLRFAALVQVRTADRRGSD